MKKATILIFSLFFLTNLLHSQKRIDLKVYAKDTLTLLTALNYLESKNENRQDKYGLLNTDHSDILKKYTEGYDSVYIFSVDKLLFNYEFDIDGIFPSIFLFDKNISKIFSCSWIELKEIQVKKNSICLKLILNKKINNKLISSILYKFKIKAPRHSYKKLNGYYAPKYRLKNKRYLKAP